MKAKRLKVASIAFAGHAAVNSMVSEK